MKKTRRRFKKKGRARSLAPPQSAAMAPAAAPEPMRGNILQAAEQKVEAQLTPENRENYLKVVVLGMKAGLSGGPNSILASMRQSKDPVRDSAIGAINLVLMLRKEGRDTMPVQALVPAAMTLMLHALDFADRAGLVKVGRAELVHATRIFTNYMFNVFEITPQMLQGLSRRVNGITQDPSQMERMARHAGVVKSPLASVPTTLPDESGLINQAPEASNV